MAALLRTVIIILLVAFSTAPISAAEKRVALVIGNGDYQQLPRLLNSPADAALIEKSLRNVGFKTFLVTNGTRQDMVRSLKSFTDAIDQDTAVLVFYAGHGIQFDQENYLIPVDSQLTSADDLPLEAFSLKLITEQISRVQPKIAVFVLDACRNNPLEKASRSATGATQTRGLARATGPLGSFIAFATAPGDVATDGSNGNSPFTRALADVITAPGLPIEQVFKRVRERVVTETKGKQVPWDNSSLTKDFFFTEALPAEPTLSAAAAKDAEAWQSASDADIASSYRSYLSAFPQGLFADIAQLRLDVLDRKQAAPADQQQASLPARDRTIDAANDLTTWTAIPQNGTPEQYRDYLEKFPNGVFAKLARLRLEAVSREGAADVAALPDKITARYEEFADDPLYPEVTDCDREAGHVQEIADPAVGVYFKQIVPERAVPACLKALQQYPDSLRILMNYGRAIDAAGRHDEAREIYRAGAEAGFPIAYRSLGDVYRDGRGIEKNLNEARYWYVLGAAKKNVFAEFNLALIYENGLGVPKNPEKAAYWLWRAARQGFAPAMEKLSAYYLAGTVVPKDMRQAEILLTGAAEMGHIYAEYQLGNLLIDGTQLAKNETMGTEWVSRAARQGYNEAQHRLGELYLEGKGVPKDATKALSWFLIAKQSGLEKAAAQVETVEAKIGKKEARKAEKLAADFRKEEVK
ncbi:caspase family protein [Rhizobium sp. SG2393]|uniref:caspase family protein n=1 Tax=Rhizobium sp. SG2393 TaxID=3276279 RepID=UPI00366D32F2